MNDPASEIVHITQGYIPLSKFLTRLAQSTHNALQDQIAALAKMPVPAAAMNGNSTIPNGDVEDGSNENIAKKTSILNFAMREHRKWVKALVITEWSRKADMVSKLIDLRFHLQGQEVLFAGALDVMGHVKRDLTFARMPSPDLKTALQVLSTGEAAWMPDLSYIEPPLLTPEEQIQWMSDVDTQLSLRLNLEDFDKIPHHFREYEIDSGRVTFKVPGEFEVDLTIADEDFEKQFWFIDFRFAFKPSASSIPEVLKNYLEGHVNDILSKDGLLGCYQFLHELVLTHKLNELKRQAHQMSKGSWTGTLKVEPLNRALAIQYWTSRTQPGTPKSWVLVAVSSGRKANGQLNPKSPSYLTAKWYRDNKEVKNVDISFDTENLSAEALLKTVIGRHIDFLLGSIHNKLQSYPRFRNREAAMVLRASQEDPAASSLSMQVGYKDSAALLIEPTTGVFAVKPHSKFTIQHEHQLNNGKNPAEDGAACLENVRCGVMEDELNRRGSTMDWATKKCPLNKDELRSVTKTRDWTKTIWLQRAGWGPNWFVMVLLSPSGDEWWLLEVDRSTPGQVTKMTSKLPLNKGYPHLDDEFWNNLTLFATGMIAQAVDARELYQHRIKFRPQETRNWALPKGVRLPTLEIALSGIFPSMVFDGADKDSTKSATGQSNAGVETSQLGSVVQSAAGSSISTKQPWAGDIVSVRFKGVQAPDTESSDVDGAKAGEAKSDFPLTCISDAIIKVRRPGKFAMLKGTMVGRDVSWNARTGEFCLRMRSSIGQSILESLKTRVKAVDRFVSFVESMDKAKGSIKGDSVSLKEVAFSYGPPLSETSNAVKSSLAWRVRLNLSKNDIDIKMEESNPHLLVVDLMQKLVNGTNGIEALMDWLPTSLPALEAVKKMREAWTDVEARHQGRFKFTMGSTDLMSLQYFIVGPGPGHQPIQREITLVGHLKQRRGESWWHISRQPLANGAPPPHDEFTTALKPIWEAKGDNWNGLVTGAAGRPSNGVAGLLLAIDEAIRPLAGTSPQNNSEVVVLE
ncbi:mediator complex subunit [Fusarium torreyae]|uniref:Mediator of RNA polymerase II transcription subunit 14 n=1 Tax=Fusarium torreyae TaxID=1237075 RepID=A0A9W8VQW1_9HYPO|nr:mediator complex subunit [Fusarium torreyae]